MAEPTPCRVRCRVCSAEWHARDPVASWRNHWRLMHSEPVQVRQHVGPVTVRRSIYDGTR